MNRLKIFFQYHHFYHFPRHRKTGKFKLNIRELVSLQGVFPCFDSKVDKGLIRTKFTFLYMDLSNRYTHGRVLKQLNLNAINFIEIRSHSERSLKRSLLELYLSAPLLIHQIVAKKDIYLNNRRIINKNV